MLLYSVYSSNKTGKKKDDIFVPIITIFALKYFFKARDLDLSNASVDLQH